MTETLHASSLGDWLDCPRRAFLRHHARQDPSYKPRPKVEGLVGTAAHRGAQAAILHGGLKRNVAYDAIDAALDRMDWSPKVERELRYSAHTKTIHQAKGQARLIARAVWKHAETHLRKLFDPRTKVEQETIYNWRPEDHRHIELELHCRPDWSWLLPDTHAVIDLKTGNDIGVVQMGAYMVVVGSHAGIVLRAPVEAAAKGAPYVETINVPPVQAKALFLDAMAAASRILASSKPAADLLPTNSHSLICNGCRWRDSCVHYQWESKHGYST